MAEASRLPEVAKEMKCLPAGEAALPPPPPGVSTPAVSLPPEPTFLARISRVLLFPGNVAGVAETAATTGEGRRGEIASNFASSTGKRGKGLGRRSLALIPRDGNKRNVRAMKKLRGFTLPSLLHVQ
ncbi:hypothetical protein EAG_14275 [Camponotus floridanus]|uniref:Uncharacterized protein n=1 Tax=Camponotus floridanus TaxID=104421 RepID=E2A4E5_CAMFO|nr:hypothetical protein EAG_14275 [Camponotus floridanus]